MAGIIDGTGHQHRLSTPVSQFQVPFPLPNNRCIAVSPAASAVAEPTALPTRCRGNPVRGIAKLSFMNSIRAITFDLDDTLWDIEVVIVQAERHVYEWLSRHCPKVTERYSPQDMREIRVRVVDDFPHYSHDMSELRRLAFARMFEGSGYGEEWVDRTFEEFLAMRNRVELFPDAVPALTRLTQHFPLGSVTNGNADLCRIGIHHHFAATITARDYGVAKPHPDLFLAACSALQCEPHQVLHIGDHPEHDVLGAAGAGLGTIWLNRRGSAWPHETKADAEAGNLYDVLRILNIGD